MYRFGISVLSFVLNRKPMTISQCALFKGKEKAPDFELGAFHLLIKRYDNRELTAWWWTTFEEVVDQVDDVTNVDDPVTRDISTNLWARFRTILI